MKSIGNYGKDNTEKHDSNASCFNLNRVSDRSQKKGSAHMVLFSPKGTSLKLFEIELSYIMPGWRVWHSIRQMNELSFHESPDKS